jgi:hypothetical protein
LITHKPFKKKCFVVININFIVISGPGQGPCGPRKGFRPKKFGL